METSDLASALGAVSMTTVLGTTDTATLEEFQEMALSLMVAHGLGDWTFEFDQAKRRAGWCVPSKRLLSFSAPLMSRWTREQQRQIVLHEIAHGLTPGHHHDATWQLTCMRIGAKPDRTWGHDGEEEVELRWTGTCPSGHTVPRERRPSGPRSCPKCSPRYDTAYLLTWTRNY